MEQFNLDKWLQDKSRKVKTRRGNPVRIICTDRKHGEDDLPIVFLEENNGGEFLLACRNDGRCDNYDTQYDLFFADEEGLTEFEKELNRIVIAFSDAHAYMDENEIHHYSKGLLDLARKELLKDLPKWKRTTDPTRKTRSFLGIGAYELYDGKGFYIELDELEKLPKEE